MPQYTFKCDSDKGGCGIEIPFTCQMSKFDESKPKKCPSCKCKHVYQSFDIPYLSMPVTLGSLVDKNSDKMSADEKHYLTEKHNEYKKPPKDGIPTWTSTPDGFKHKSQLKD